MGDDPTIDPKLLRGLVGATEPEAEEPTAFAKHVAEVLTRALGQLRASGVIEVEDANYAGLTEEVIAVALEASTPNKMSRKIVRTLIRSDLVEEVYGSDDEIAGALMPFFEEL
ncbi:MAG: hypothetical protein AAF430_19255 [Myxococcota bacterium]